MKIKKASPFPLRSIISQGPNDSSKSQQTRILFESVQMRGVRKSSNLVLMYFPSFVLSLSLVAFSEPAKSIRL
jgi:hypothetical protein